MVEIGWNLTVLITRTVENPKSLWHIACKGEAVWPAGRRKGFNMSFGLFLLGILILGGGLVYGAVLMHVPSHWIVVMVLFIAGLGIIKGVQSTRSRDS